LRTYPFQTRARTVDHLGREQIADTPTAVSELWKNAYDAYATSVGLHIFGGESALAVIVDDGCGMSRSDFVDRWLVLGTEAKVDDDTAALDRNGLPPRVRQGQKGIGRLSIAFLSPLVLVLTKRQGIQFVASLIDWRLFENPNLNLEDIAIPVAEFSERTEFAPIFRQLLDESMDNVWGRNGAPERNSRIEEAWSRFAEREREGGLLPTTADRIATSALNAEIPEQCLSEWPAWRGERDRGTALFALELRDELRAWVDPDKRTNDDEAKNLRESLVKTLTGFIDPFVEKPSDFSYQVVAHRPDGNQVVISSAEQFGLHDLRELEHYLEGRFDEYGTFAGHVRAFGKDLGEVTIPPSRGVRTGSQARVGPFDFCLGTFEQNEKNSTHSPEIYRALTARVEMFAGLRIYRDGLRVMPYGRPEVDFFGIEERRSKNAGREFWQHRRMYGRIAIAKSANPNLRDKAGREGLIDNAARRELRELVVELLKLTARRYFGSASDYRDQLLKDIRAFNIAAAEAERRSVRMRSRTFIAHLKAQSEPLREALATVATVRGQLEQARVERHAERVLGLAEEVENALELRGKLKPPPKPPSLGNTEGEYRRFRDHYNELSASIEALSNLWADCAGELAEHNPLEVARSALSRHQKFLSDEVAKWLREIRPILNQELIRIQERADQDRGRYYQLAAPLLNELEGRRTSVQPVLASLESIRESQYQEISTFYGSYYRAIRQLSEGIDLDSAIAWSSDRRADLETKVNQLSALAQLGITVEIVGHELETLDAEVGRNLRRLPASIRSLEAYKLAYAAHEALVNRLRFLTPLRLSGPQLKDTITGEQIGGYLAQFFDKQLTESRTTFESTAAFRSLQLVDFSHRLYPVFINLINNALYWLKQGSADRKIVLDVAHGDVVVADSGPGVDPDDEEHLFELFFSRRVEGRGVGLYLCRANLAASGHTIAYRTGGPVLPGANFLIRFRGPHNG
jgi:signal transduction histidine kinase